MLFFFPTLMFEKILKKLKQVSKKEAMEKMNEICLHCWIVKQKDSIVKQRTPN